MDSRPCAAVNAIRWTLDRGVTRGDAMRYLGSAGMGLAVSGGVFGRAAQALANTPKRGGQIRVAGISSSTADTLDPARRTLSTDYEHCQMFDNGLTSAGRQPHAAAGAGRDDRE